MYLNMYVQLHQEVNFCPECEKMLQVEETMTLERNEVTAHDTRCKECDVNVLVLRAKFLPEGIWKAFKEQTTLIVQSPVLDLEQEAIDDYEWENWQ